MLCDIAFDDTNKTARLWFEMGQSMGVLKTKVDDDPLRWSAVDERMRMALIRLREELNKKKEKMYRYDYAWILQIINEYNKKKIPTFKRFCFEGVTDWRRYLLRLGIEEVGGISMLSEYYSLVAEGEFPDWKFMDEPEPGEAYPDIGKRRRCSPSERLRRIGIVRRFLVLYRQSLAMAA